MQYTIQESFSREETIFFMKFYDKVQIVVQSGKGWDWATSARREAWVPYGGPNWGNGGHGWAVIFEADRNYNTLLHLKFQKIRTAWVGFPGESADKYGKSADDLIIYVPVWSVIKVVQTADDLHIDGTGNLLLQEKLYNKESDKIIYHFTEHWEQFTVCKGGLGWAGNMHFKNSQVQYPDFSLMGEPGQKKMIEIELQLLADIGLIGTPSVGKSSIINSISNTKAKVAEYHFTTLIPKLGSVIRDDTSRNIIDIPGLVQGASSGKWLGNEFLRHVLKARLFAFVLDASRWDEGIGEFGVLRTELISYIKNRFVGSFEFGYEITDIQYKLKIVHNQIILYIYDQNDNILLQKWIIWIINKIDEVWDSEVIWEYQKQLQKHIMQSIGSKLDRTLDATTMEKVLEEQIIVYSIILDERKKPLLQFITQKLSSIEPFEMHFDPVAASHLENAKSVECVGSLEDEEIQDLLDILWFRAQERETVIADDHTDTEEWDESSELDEDDEDLQIESATQTRKLYKVYDKELTRLAYQLPWGKVLAEERFWRVMKQQGIHRWLGKAWVLNGDLLRVVSDYDTNKHIVFPYVLGTTKTSYKTQKLT